MRETMTTKIHDIDFDKAGIAHYGKKVWLEMEQERKDAETADWAAEQLKGVIQKMREVVNAKPIKDEDIKECLKEIQILLDDIYFNGREIS